MSCPTCAMLRGESLILCQTDYCEPKRHPHEGRHLTRVPWVRDKRTRLPAVFAVCDEAIAAMKEAPEIKAAWAEVQRIFQEDEPKMREAQIERERAERNSRHFAYLGDDDD